MTRILFLLLVSLSLAACGSRNTVNGNLVTDERLARIEPGFSTVEDVLYTLGSPSAISTFDRHVWYYIGETSTQFAFFQRDVTGRRIVEIHFDDLGTVAALNEMTEDDAVSVELVDRQTPTLGREITVFEQLLGNIGRFSGDEE